LALEFCQVTRHFQFVSYHKQAKICLALTNPDSCIVAGVAIRCQAICWWCSLTVLSTVVWNIAGLENVLQLFDILPVKYWCIGLRSDPTSAHIVSCQFGTILDGFVLYLKAGIRCEYSRCLEDLSNFLKFFTSSK
jgi:hypothetical protein